MLDYFLPQMGKLRAEEEALYLSKVMNEPGSPPDLVQHLGITPDNFKFLVYHPLHLLVIILHFMRPPAHFDIKVTSEGEGYDIVGSTTNTGPGLWHGNLQRGTTYIPTPVSHIFTYFCTCHVACKTN